MDEINFLIAAINNAVNNPISKIAILVLKVIFIFISLVLFLFIIYFITKTRWFKFRFLETFSEFFTYKPLGSKKITKQWQKIKILLESGLESNYKLAIIEADSLLEENLKKLGYPGETMDEILEKISANIISNIEEVRQAHRIRNNIIHDLDYKLELGETQKIIAIYERSLVSLGLL